MYEGEPMSETLDDTGKVWCEVIDRFAESIKRHVVLPAIDRISTLERELAEKEREVERLKEIDWTTHPMAGGFAGKWKLQFNIKLSDEESNALIFAFMQALTLGTAKLNAENARLRKELEAKQ
jgi:hypothetical protein